MVSIIDVFYSEGNFVTLKSIINSNVKTNHIEYIGLIKAIIEYIGINNMKWYETSKTENLAIYTNALQSVLQK